MLKSAKVLLVVYSILRLLYAVRHSPCIAIEAMRERTKCKDMTMAFDNFKYSIEHLYKELFISTANPPMMLANRFIDNESYEFCLTCNPLEGNRIYVFTPHCQRCQDYTNDQERFDDPTFGNMWWIYTEGQIKHIVSERDKMNETTPRDMCVGLHLRKAYNDTDGLLVEEQYIPRCDTCDGNILQQWDIDIPFVHPRIDKTMCLQSNYLMNTSLEPCGETILQNWQLRSRVWVDEIEWVPPYPESASPDEGS